MGLKYLVDFGGLGMIEEMKLAKGPDDWLGKGGVEENASEVEKEMAMLCSLSGYLYLIIRSPSTCLYRWLNGCFG